MSAWRRETTENLRLCHGVVLGSLGATVIILCAPPKSYVDRHSQKHGWQLDPGDFHRRSCNPRGGFSTTSGALWRQATRLAAPTMSGTIVGNVAGIRVRVRVSSSNGESKSRLSKFRLA